MRNNYKQQLEKYLYKISGSKNAHYIAENFTKYSSRQELTRFIFRRDLFEKIISSKGSIIECGVCTGSGLMAWAQLSSIMEPMAFNRRIYGFDTFEGFPSIHDKDNYGSHDHGKNVGDIRDESYDDLLNCIKIYDSNRFIGDVDKVEIIKGDFLVTSESFINDNPHLIISLLYLDFDLYEPTKKALELFLPRMHKGAVIGFDEINNPNWPGETLALLEKMNINDYSINKFYYEPHMSYITLN